MEFKPSEAILLLFATIGPLKATIVCAGLTAHATPAFVKRLASRAVLIATGVCLVFALLGELILLVFQVSLPAFQIAGGIIVMVFSIAMVTGDKTAAQRTTVEEPLEPTMDVATYPIAVPLLASVSGLIAIVSLVAQTGNELRGLLFVAAVIVAIMGCNYICLRGCQWIARALGPVALMVINKIMGVILVALAVELFVMGLIGFGVMPPVR